MYRKDIVTKTRHVQLLKHPLWHGATASLTELIGCLVNLIIEVQFTPVGCILKKGGERGQKKQNFGAFLSACSSLIL